MKHKMFISFAKRALVGVLSASMLLVGNIGPTVVQAAQISSPEELSPITFKVADVTAQPGETVTLDITTPKGSGFSAAMGKIDVTDGINAIKVYRGELQGSLTYSKKTGNLLFLSSDGCNVNGEGVVGSIDVTIPEDIKPGKYPVKWDVNQVSYALEDLSGQLMYPESSIETEVGYITIPEKKMTPEDLSPVSFKVEDVTAKPGETVTIKVNTPEGNKFSSAMGVLVTTDGITVARVSKGTLGGSTMYSERTGNALFLSSDGCNVSGEGSVFKVRLNIPEDIKPGKYAVKWNVDQVSYALEDLSGQLMYPVSSIKTEAGYITIPEEEPDQPDQPDQPGKPDQPDQPDTPAGLTVTTNVNNWGSGYQVSVKLSNETDKTVDGWTLKIKKSDIDIDAIWSANLTEEGDYYVITPVEWNKTLTRGTSTEFGMQGSGHIADKVEILVDGKPAAGTDTPDQPDQPSQPDTPDQPDQPDTPDQPDQPDTPDTPSGKVETITGIDFGKEISLAEYDYKNIKKIVVKFAGSAKEFSGAVVLGEWNQQVSFDNTTLSDNAVTLEVTSPQSSLTIYKWWSNTALEIESIELVY